MGTVPRGTVPRDFKGVPELDDFSQFDPYYHGEGGSPHDPVYIGGRFSRSDDVPRQVVAKERARKLHPSRPVAAFSNPARPSTTNQTYKSYYSYATLSFRGMWQRTVANAPYWRNLFEQVQEPYRSGSKDAEPLVGYTPADGSGAIALFPVHGHIDLDINDSEHPGRDICEVRRIFEYGWALLCAEAAPTDPLAGGYDFAAVRAVTARRFKPGKQSMHVVYHLPGCRMFFSNLHFGALVTRIMERCQRLLGVAPADSPLYVQRTVTLKDGQKTEYVPIVDFIYTRNRNFCAAYNTKQGANPQAPTYPMLLDGAPPKPVDTPDNMARFLASLVTYVPRDPDTGGASRLLQLLIAPGVPLVFDDDEESHPHYHQHRITDAVYKLQKSGEGEHPFAEAEAPGPGPRVTLHGLAGVAAEAASAETGHAWCVHRVFTNGFVQLVKDSYWCPYKNGDHSRQHSKAYLGGWLRLDGPVFEYYCQSENCKAGYSAPIGSSRSRRIAVHIAPVHLERYRAAAMVLLADHVFTARALGIAVGPAAPAPAPAEPPAVDGSDDDDDDDE